MFFYFFFSLLTHAQEVVDAAEGTKLNRGEIDLQCSVFILLIRYSTKLIRLEGNLNYCHVTYHWMFDANICLRFLIYQLYVFENYWEHQIPTSQVL